jgi:hypothetical protein
VFLHYHISSNQIISRLDTRLLRATNHLAILSRPSFLSFTIRSRWIINTTSYCIVSYERLAIPTLLAPSVPFSISIPPLEPISRKESATNWISATRTIHCTLTIRLSTPLPTPLRQVCETDAPNIPHPPPPDQSYPQQPPRNPSPAQPDPLSPH